MEFQFSKNIQEFNNTDFITIISLLISLSHLFSQSSVDEIVMNTVCRVEIKQN